jgi:hypothetical protein
MSSREIEEPAGERARGEGGLEEMAGRGCSAVSASIRPHLDTEQRSAVQRVSPSALQIRICFIRIRIQPKSQSGSEYRSKGKIGRKSMEIFSIPIMSHIIK